MVVVGIGLMEIITEPDFSSSAEAVSFVKELQLILQTLGTCDGRMEGMWSKVGYFISVFTILMLNAMGKGIKISLDSFVNL